MFFKIIIVIFLIINISFYHCNDLLSKLKCIGNNQHWGCGPTTIECIPLCKNKNYGGVCPDECVEMCICIEGYLRDKNGKCIPEDKCPVINQCNAPNEYFGCEPTKLQCKPLCENIKFNGSCPDDCDNVCTCIDGYLRNSEGVCITEDKCPVKECHRENEYLGCESTTFKCKPLCDNKDYNGFCSDDCEIKCTCEEGYLRVGDHPNIHDSELCISEIYCPPKCDRPNEHLGCEYTQHQCKPLCANVNYPGMCYSCKVDCTCKKGYLRNRKGVCILKKSCPELKCARPNEVYGCECKEMAYKPLCGNDENKIGQCPNACKMMCTCEYGYMRNGNNGLCIRKSECRKKRKNKK